MRGHHLLIVGFVDFYGCLIAGLNERLRVQDKLGKPAFLPALANPSQGRPDELLLQFMTGSTPLLK
jgi:hypothetical protein